MSIFEIEIRGDIYEIEADDENDAVTKAKIAFPDTTAPPPPKQEPAKEPNVVSKFLGIPQLREDLKKGGKETAELWEQGKPVQSYLHSLGTIGGQVGGAVGYPLLNLGKAMLPKSAEERIAATAKNIFTPTAQSRIPTSTMPGMTGSAPIGAPEARPPAEVFAEKHPDITRGTGDIMNIAGMIPAIKGGTMVAKAGAETAYSTAKGLNKTIGKYAAEKSGVSEEALRMAGKKEGRKTLEKAFGTQAEIGQELVDAIDNAWDVIPKSAEIKTALKAVPKVDPEPILNKIIESLPEATTAEMKAAAVKIQGKGDELLNLADKSGKIPADKLFAFRQEVDNVIGDSFGKESGKYVTALKGIRMSIKDELIKTAKGTEYESTMKDMAKKLDALDKIKTLVGKSGTTRELRSESFIRNINSLGKEKKREWLQNFEEVFGGDFAERAKLAQFAEQMGNEGKGTILPRWTTGRSTLTKGVGLATGSPIITSRMTLPALQGLENITKKIAKGKVELPKKTGESGFVGSRTEAGNAAFDKFMGKEISPAMEAMLKQPKTIEQMRTTLEKLAPADQSAMIERLKKIYGSDWKDYAPLFATLGAGIAVPAAAMTLSPLLQRKIKK